MPSELLIGYPHIPLLSQTTTALALTDSVTTPRTNMITGARYDFAQPSTSGTLFSTRYDLGAAVSLSVEYLFIAGARLAFRQGADRMYVQSWNGVSNTDVVGRKSLLSGATFTGPRAEDLIFVTGFNDTIAASLPSAVSRYWDLHIGHSATSAAWTVRKAYFGRFFDFGRSPRYPLTQKRFFKNSHNREARHTFEVTWDGVTDAKRTEFINTLGRYADLHPVVLWDSTNVLLNSFRTLHCTMTDFQIEPRQKDVASISITFEELT